MNTPRPSLDDTLRSATGELRHRLDRTELEPFTPNPRRTPAIAAAAVLVLGGVGATVLLTDRGNDDRVQSSTATAPASTDTVSEASPPAVTAATTVTTGPVATVTSTPPVTIEPVTDFELRIPSPIAQPSPGEELIDPSFGQPIRRVTASAADEYIVPLTTMTSAWNADESKLLLYRTTSDGEGRHELYDVADASKISDVPIAPTDIEQVAWSPTDPDVLIYVEGTSLITIDIETMTVTVERSFDECDVLTPSVGGAGLSADGDVIALWCGNDSGDSIIAYRFSTQAVVQVATDARKAPLVAPSGSRFVLPMGDKSAVVLDDQLQPTGVAIDDFATVASDATGRDVAVGPVFGGEQIGSLVATDLTTGVVEVIVGPETGAPFPPGGNTVSAVGDLVVFSTRNLGGFVDDALNDTDFIADWAALDGEVVLVDLGTAEPTTIRLAHNRTTQQLDFWSSTFVSLSPSGERVAFSTDWGGRSSVDTYVIDVVR